MILLSHRDCKTVWQATVKRAEAAATLLSLILAWRFAAGPAAANEANPADPPRELDPAGWRAVWREGGRDEPLEIPPIPPAPPAA